jgi:hypothetical protein
VIEFELPPDPALLRQTAAGVARERLQPATLRGCRVPAANLLGGRGALCAARGLHREALA